MAEIREKRQNYEYGYKRKLTGLHPDLDDPGRIDPSHIDVIVRIGCLGV
jgi:hypothetical protein